MTTASLGALRSYAAGLDANDIQGNSAAAIQDFREAIAQDSTFTMAYVWPIRCRRSAARALGELYEAAGDATHATEYYGRFVDLLANADSDLQPRVAEARARMAQLNRAKQ